MSQVLEIMFDKFKGLKIAGFDNIPQFQAIVREMIHIYNVVQATVL